MLVLAAPVPRCHPRGPGLGTPRIYVFTGMLKAIHNDNELAGVIGHEIAHAILNHSAETLSLSGFFNIFSLALVTMIWAVIPSDILLLIFPDLIIRSMTHNLITQTFLQLSHLILSFIYLIILLIKYYIYLFLR